MKRMSSGECLVWWDWTDQPDWGEINDALQEFKEPTLVPIYDTGCDSYALMIAERPLTIKEAQRLFDEWVG